MSVNFWSRCIPSSKSEDEPSNFSIEFVPESFKESIALTVVQIEFLFQSLVKPLVDLYNDEIVVSVYRDDIWSTIIQMLES